MRSSRRQRLREIYAFRCGYCGVTERDTGALLTTDHFQPRSRSGSLSLENLVYSCHACNEFKGDWWHPASERRILHPLNDDLGLHIREDDSGRLQAITPTGAFHIERLHLNRGPLILQRQERRNQSILAAFEASALQRLDALETQVAALEEIVKRLSQ